MSQLERLSRATIGLSLLAAVAAPSPALGQSEFRITGISFDWETLRRLAPGSEGWPLTWCEDGHQYASWGDGGGFGGSQTDGMVSLGFARIEGPYESFTGHNVWGGKDAENPATFNGKSTSILCLNGNLYAWRSLAGQTGAFQWKQIIRSTSKAATWEENVFPDSRLEGCVGCPGLPFFINYGQNYSANSDGFVYVYTIRIADPTLWDVQKPGVIWLARAPAAGEAFADTANWEWVVGFSGSDPQWGAIASRVPVLEDADGVMRSSVLYLPGLQRYVMVTNHTARDLGNIAIWEAPQPWGPWTLVTKEFGWPGNDPNAPPEGALPRTFSFGNFGPKWLGADGQDCVLVGLTSNSWDSVGCRFQITDLTAPSTPTDLIAAAVTSTRIDLSWSAASDPQSGISQYRVYRDGTLVGTSGPPAFSDIGLAPSTAYSYRVSAVNGDDLEGPLSDQASATTFAPDDSLIFNCIAESGSAYRVAEEGLSVGAKQYTDGAINLESFPQQLAGRIYVATPYADRNAVPGSASFLTCEASRDIILYVAHDDRIPRPAWLTGGFVHTTAEMQSAAGTFSIYLKHFPAGPVTLGSNVPSVVGAGSMYTVVVHPDTDDVDLVPPGPPRRLRAVATQ
ncbi:MAG: hypothetical protein JSU87_15850 [Gemmatimonadota bacterium]|nr:MAG: hypothetical protein JSU87_15850 [Gemmatimonadota bacterium]